MELHPSFIKEIAKDVYIGLEFEFFSSLNRKELARVFSRNLRKKVHPIYKYHSGAGVGKDTFKLEPDFSGGFKMNELVTGPLQYYEALNIMYKVYNLIEEYGHTTERTGVHLNISFRERNMNLKYRISELNEFKFILNLEEEKIFQLFPEAKSKLQRIHKSAISLIFPRNNFMSTHHLEDVKHITNLAFSVPESKHFGVNFSKIHKGYVEIRYIGGKDYHLKKDESRNLINHIIFKLYATLSENYEYSDSELNRIQNELIQQNKLVHSLKEYENFIDSYPNIQLMVDLKNNGRIVREYYRLIREKLFHLIVYGNLRSGFINYDSLKDVIQVKNGRIKNGYFISDVEFFNCAVEGEFSQCGFNMCTVRSSKLEECKFFTDNDIRYSHIHNCNFYAPGNVIKQTYIFNARKRNLLIRADIIDCILRKGVVSLESSIDDKTEYIEGGRPQ
jgi:hypothetical protein